MRGFPKEFKESLVVKVLSNDKHSIRSVAKEANVGVSSLHKWVQQAKHVGGLPGLSISEPINKRPCDWSQAEKFNAVAESLSLKTEEINHYCRQKGIYSSQLAQWKLDFMSDKEETSSKQMAAELKVLRAQNKELQRELNRKEKALAEASALLLLKKKADLLWGVAEDDPLKGA